MLGLSEILENDLFSEFRFRVDDKFVVDATMDGGRARFINHSCGPNCMSKIITVDGRKVIYLLIVIPKAKAFYF